MKVLFLGFILVGILEGVLATYHRKLNGTQATIYIDVVIQDLSYHFWEEDENQCLQEITSTLNNIKNSTLWATWIWDSTQLPVGVLFGSKLQLGNFDECLNAPWKISHPELRTQYCLAEVQLSSLEPQRRISFDPYGSTIPYIENISKYYKDFRTIMWGVCVPETCKPGSVSKLLRTLLQNSHFGSMDSNVSIEINSCQIAGKPQHHYTSGFITFAILTLMLILIVMISTWYVSGLDHEKHQSTIITKLATSYCFNQNIQDLVKPYKEDIRVLHGIRFLSACVIVMFHQHIDSNLAGPGNYIKIEEFKDSLFGHMLIHADLVVDTFLVISGLLLAKTYMSRTMTNPILLLLKRYIRLIGPFAVMVFYMAAVFTLTGSGPLWHRLADPRQANCQKNWWLSLLMVNNIIKADNICYGISWYISCEYQLAVLGTALFYLRQKNRHIGVALFAAVAILSIFIPGLINFWNEYPGTPHCNGIQDMESVIYIYYASYSRAGSYVVGLASGYIMAVYKPTVYRRIMSQKLSLLVTFLAMALMSIIMYLGGWFYTREYNVLEASVFVALNRVTWAVALVSIVASCEYGTVPIISNFLSWSVFVPLSRLSYGLYIIHYAITLRNVFSSRSPLNMDFFITITDSLGVIAASCFASLVMWLLIEAPIANLSKLVFDSKCRLRTRQIAEYDVNKQSS